MSSQSKELYQSLESVSDCVEQSKSAPVIVFKHSSICPTSSYAKREMDAFIDSSKITAYLVVVQNQRQLSNEIADHLSIKHESPQALCLKHGQVVTSLSHYDITQDNLTKAFAE